MKSFRALKHRSFALLWGGQTLSRAGDGIYRVALAWWVLEKTGSAAEMGKVLVSSYVPMLLFLLVGGVVIDRLPRARVMLLSDLARAAVVLGVAALAFVQQLEVWHAYVAGVVFGVVNAFFQPAYVVVVPEVVPREALHSANALTSLSKQSADVLGPVIGGSLVAAGGTTAAFALDGLSFLLSAACLLPLLRLPAMRARAKGRSGALGDLREGLQTVFALKWLWITIVVASVANVALTGPVSVALPLLVKEQLGGGARSLGLTYSMLGVGSVLGSVWLGRMTVIRRHGLVLYGSMTAGGLMLLLFGMPVTIFGVWAAALAAGAAFGVAAVIWVSMLQELVPREVLGRVASVDYFGSYALLPVGYGLTGWAADRFGPAAVFVIGGALTAALSALALSQRAVRCLGDAPAKETGGLPDSVADITPQV